MSCITCQTIDAAKALDNLEDLCRWYASEVDRLQSKPTPQGDEAVAAELAEARRDMAKLNRVIADRNLEIESLRKVKP